MEIRLSLEDEEFLTRQELRLTVSGLAEAYDNLAALEIARMDLGWEEREAGYRDMATRGHAIARGLREETA